MSKRWGFLLCWTWRHWHIIKCNSAPTQDRSSLSELFTVTNSIFNLFSTYKILDSTLKEYPYKTWRLICINPCKSRYLFNESCIIHKVIFYDYRSKSLLTYLLGLHSIDFPSVLFLLWKHFLFSMEICHVIPQWIFLFAISLFNLLLLCLTQLCA